MLLRIRSVIVTEIGRAHRRLVSRVPSRVLRGGICSPIVSERIRDRSRIERDSLETSLRFLQQRIRSVVACHDASKSELTRQNE